MVTDTDGEDSGEQNGQTGDAAGGEVIWKLEKVNTQSHESGSDGEHRELFQRCFDSRTHKISPFE